MAAPARSGNTCTIFVIDVSPTLARKYQLVDGFGDQASSREVTGLQYGLEYVKSKAGAMLLAGLKTVHCGVVLFGTDVTENSLAGSTQGYDYLWEYILPGQPDASTLLKLDAIASFQTQETKEDKGDAMTALILALHILDLKIGHKKIARKVIIVTDGESSTDWDDLDGTIEKMNKDGVQLTVVGLDFDDEEFGLKQENKSETKAENEKMFHHICGLLWTPSIVGPLSIALPDALSPTPKITASRATPLTLTLGFPGEPEAAREAGFDPEHTLKINVIVKKCSSSVRPMTMQNIGKEALKTEKARRKRDAKVINALVAERLKKEKKKKKNADVEANDDMDEEDEELTQNMSGMINVVKKYVYVNTRGVHQENGSQPDATLQKSHSQVNKRKRPHDTQLEGSDGEDGHKDGHDERADHSDEEEAPMELVSDPSRLQKVYKYGTDKVPLDEVDAAELKTQFSPCLEVLGFVSTQEIPRHHLLNDVSYLFANPEQSLAQLTLSALIHGMMELTEQKSILCRYVGTHKSAEPKLMVLIPEMSGGIQFCWFIQVPFAEDIREYSFPSLELVNTRDGKVLSQHKNIPTEEMNDVVDQLVKDMDLNDLPKSEEGEEAEPLLDFESAYSPSVHHLKNCVLYRLSHPDSHILPAVHPALSKYLQPHPIIQERSSDTVKNAVSLFGIHKVPPKKTSGKRGEPRTVPGDESQDIDVDAILGEGESTLSHREVNEEKTKNEDDLNEAKRRKTSESASDSMSDMEDPITGFHKALEDPEMDRVHEAVAGMFEVTQKLISSSPNQQTSKALQCLKEVRKTACEQDEVDTYNLLIARLKTMLFPHDSKQNDFWDQIVQHRLGLISAPESAGNDGASQKEVDEFYLT